MYFRQTPIWLMKYVDSEKILHVHREPNNPWEIGFVAYIIEHKYDPLKANLFLRYLSAFSGRADSFKLYYFYRNVYRNLNNIPIY